MGVITVGRIGLQALANLSLLIAACLTLAAMFTAQWQIADFGKGEVYEHGLYKDCVKSNDQRSGIITTGDWLCFWKFDQKNQERNNIKAVLLKDWQVSAMGLLGSSCALAIIAIICSCITYCLRYFSIPWAALSFVASVLSLAGIITFLRWSHESDNRLFQMKDIIVEQRYGSSLSIAIAGCVMYFLATVMAGIAVGLVFMEGKRNEGGRHTSNGISLGHATKV